MIAKPLKLIHIMRFLFIFCTILLFSACSGDFNEGVIDDLFFQQDLDCDPAALDTLRPDLPDGLLSICVEPVELWKEEFDNNDFSWPVSGNTAEIKDGQYRLEAQAWNALVDLDPAYMKTNFELELWMQIPGTGSQEKGIWLFTVDRSGYEAYAFVMNATGKAGLYYTNDYSKNSVKYQQLLPDQAGNFHYDPGLVSQLLVRRWQNKYYFFFNGAYLGTVPDMVWKGNSMCIRVEQGAVNVERINYRELK